MKTFMLLLAFTVMDPEGVTMDEEVHILSRHFDDQTECKDFVDAWGDVIRHRGPRKVQEMVDNKYTVKLKYVGCVPAPDQKVLEIKPQPIDETLNEED